MWLAVVSFPVDWYNVCGLCCGDALPPSTGGEGGQLYGSREAVVYSPLRPERYHVCGYTGR